MRNFLKNLLYIGDSQKKSFALCALIFLLYSLLKLFIASHYSPSLPEVVMINDSTLIPNQIPSNSPGTLADLNLATEQQLIDLGLRPWIAKRLIKYRKTVKSFSSKVQLDKIYGINQNELEILQTYFLIHQKSKSDPPEMTKTASARFELKPFDPNTCNLDDLLSMGISESIAKSIINFRNSGYVYKNPEDLKKIYTMKPDLYEKIKPFIIFNDNKKTNNAQLTTIEYSKKSEVKRTQLLDINECNSEELITIPGIGKYYAGKIIKYREGLGGYLNKEQLLDLKILPDSIYEKAKPYLSILIPAKKIEINKVKLDDLENMWYIGKQAYLIINYRTAKGAINNFDELASIQGLNVEKIKKVASYLDYSR